MVRAAHVLVGGGTGFVGRHLVNCLRNAGAKVQLITRKPKSSDQISWDKIRADGLPQDTTAVVNLAGRNILEIGPWTAAYKREVYESRINSNRLLKEAIQRASVKPQSFITVSGVGYYEPSETKEYDENWLQPPSTNSNYLMALAKDWEAAGDLDEQLAPSTRRVIIRSGVVIGRDGGIIENSLLPYKMGLGGPVASGQQWFPWIHVDDLAELFKFSLQNDHVTGVINGVAPEQVKNKDFATSMGRALNRPAFIHMPEFVVKLMFGPERADILIKGQRVKSRAGLLGFRYQYPNLLGAIEESVK